MDPHLAMLSLPSSQKPKRRVVHMAGPVDKKTQCSRDHIHIRELTVTQGGLGCAIWDGSIVLARWVHRHADLFAGRVGMELGAGVGLPGIACARHARGVVLTDYVEEVIANLAYNLKLNSNVEAEAEDDEETDEAEIERRRVLRRNMRASGTAALLDWHAIDPDEEDLERLGVKASDAAASSEAPAAAVSAAVAPASLPVSSRSLATYAERIASLSFTPSPHFVDPTGLGPASCDFLLGAELIYTYNKHHQHCFLHILDYFLVSGGRYYCVQSMNREGMPEFVGDLLAAGFRVWWQLALQDSGLVGPFPGEKQPKGFVQREEQYVFYVIEKSGGAALTAEQEVADIASLSLPCGVLVDAAVTAVPRVGMLRDADGIVAEKQAIAAIVGDQAEAGQKLVQTLLPKNFANAPAAAANAAASSQ